MATSYATTAQITAALQLADPNSDPASEDEVLQAEIDLDDYALGAVGTWNAQTERKLTPANLAAYQQTYLIRSVAAQVSYRRVMGEHFFVRAQLASVETPDGFKRTGTLPLVAPRAAQLLAEAGLTRRSGQLTNRRALPPNWFETAADED